MMSLPPDISPQDINQWINDGVVLAPIGEDNALIPVLAVGVNRNNHRHIAVQRLYLPDEAVMDRHELLQIPWSNVFLSWPRCGAVNVRKMALYVQRRQVRQYRRTYNSRAIETVVPDIGEALRQLGDAEVLNATTFASYTHAVFDPKYPEPYEAIRLLEEAGHFSVALSPTTVVTNAGEGSKHVYYNAQLVAKVAEGRLISLRARLPRAVTKRLGEMYVVM